MKHYEVIIIGGGIVGLSFANLLAMQGFKIALIEMRDPPLEWPDNLLDARVSAINIASERVFERIGLWEKLRVSAAPLYQMKVWDGQSGAQINFDAAEMALAHLGSVLENRVMIKALWQLAECNENITLYSSREAQTLEVNDQEIRLELDAGIQLSASLMVGCDGAHSWLGKMMDLQSREQSYQQKAIVAVIHTEKAHQNTAYQNFLATGPLALLALKNPQHCAIVWSCDLNYADELMAMTEDHFNQALTNASEFCVGKLHLLTKPHAISLQKRHVENYIKPRLALMGDAAHTMHPLAGQGVNFGLMDAQYLADLLIKAKKQNKDLASYRLLRDYERARKSENEIIIQMMSGFKSLFSSTNSLCVQVRGLGIQGLNQAAWLKNRMARYAMGTNLNFP